MSLETLSSHKEFFALVHSSIDTLSFTPYIMLLESLKEAGRRNHKEQLT